MVDNDVMIQAESLTKRYGDAEALRDASFEIKRGEIVGFLGPNGAGKTTTMKILTCFISATSGRASVAGADVEEDPVGARRAIGYLPEHNPLYTEMLVAEYLEYAAAMRGIRGNDAKRRIRKVVEATDLGPKFGSEIRELSKGYRQRVGLAQALIHEPPILILDEPLSGLDPNQARGVRELIRELGRERTVILSTHHLPEVESTCDRVLIISGGRIVADDAPEALKRSAGRETISLSLKRAEGFDDGAFIRELGAAGELRSIRPIASDEPGELLFEIVPSGEGDARERLFHEVVARGGVLLGLERRGGGLEDIFSRLTGGEGRR